MANVRVKVIVEVNGERVEKEVTTGTVNSLSDLVAFTNQVHQSVDAISNRGRRRV